MYVFHRTIGGRPNRDCVGRACARAGVGYALGCDRSVNALNLLTAVTRWTLDAIGFTCTTTEGTVTAAGDTQVLGA